jgi:hypothetical protein
MKQRVMVKSGAIFSDCFESSPDAHAFMTDHVMQRRLLADVRMSDPACHFAHSEEVAPIDHLASNHQMHPPSPNKKVAALLSLLDKGASALDATAYLVPFGVRLCCLA